MTGSIIKIKFFPLTEVVIFTLTVLSSIIFCFISGLGIWILIAMIIFSYLITMGGATIIQLNDDTLKITSFNPFLASPSIDTKSIVKINSVQILEPQSDVVFGGYFVLFAKRYELEYLDAKGRKKKAYFSILNKKKEVEIIRTLRTISQSS
jgi:hypothetical protein